MSVTNLTSENFATRIADLNANEWKYLGDKPAVIDFYATWCGPCKAMTPVLEELSQEYADVDFYKLDVDQENEIAAAFGIRSVPTFLFIPKEGRPQMAAGLMPKSEFSNVIKQTLGV